MMLKHMKTLKQLLLVKGMITTGCLLDYPYFKKNDCNRFKYTASS